MKYNVLLYYCYTHIENIETFREEHHQLCLELNLRGRIIVASEGLNGTVSGSANACQEYMNAVLKDDRFKHTEFKVDGIENPVFEKLHVRIKSEIVHSSFKGINPLEETGKYIEPNELKQLLAEDREDTVLLDVRSNYEHKVGKFKNAITLDIDNFRDFPKKISELASLQGKKIVTYCTGGIKCEKASAYLLKQGFENVYQLHGGIIKYGLEEKGEDFEGKCYVFDNRITKEVNTTNPKIISQCYITKQPSDRMVNCANPECNKHIPMSEQGAKIYDGCCSEKCVQNKNVRSYNGTGCYQKKTNGYNPYKNAKRI